MSYTSVFQQKEMVNEFSLQYYKEPLPSHTTNSDVGILFKLQERITMFNHMIQVIEEKAHNTKKSPERVDPRYLILQAVREDYDMFFYAFLFALSEHSDEIERLRMQASEKFARDGRHNVDSLAG